MPFSTAGADYQLSQWAASYALYASLHTAYSATGGNEVSGGSYARVPITWGSPSGNTISISGTPYSINVPASTTVAFLGFWSASSGGNFGGMIPLGGAAAYAFAVPSSTGVLLAPGSAYSANQPVVVTAPGGSTTPGGLTVGTIYYAKTPSSDSTSLSATSGGSAITITADGSGLVQAITTEAFSGAGNYSLTSASWTLT